jgi:hypothetical protein
VKLSRSSEATKVVSKRLGHSSIGVTAKRYLYVYSDRDAAAASVSRVIHLGMGDRFAQRANLSHGPGRGSGAKAVFGGRGGLVSAVYANLRHPSSCFA